jgi:hypothetical protein
MSHPPIFDTLTQNRMASVCEAAKTRILLAAPGISLIVATQIVKAKERVDAIRVVLDCNDETLRLGYGEIEAVRMLMNAGIVVGQSPGLRTGVIIVDQQGWSFSPTPLSVERERQSNETPNAIFLNPAQQDSVAEALGLHSCHNDQRMLFEEDAPAEVGNSPLSDAEVKAVEKSLTEAPPIPFDLQRQVRVFQPYIQYVELSLEGASLRRQTVALPPSLAPLAKNEEVQKRLRTTYSLISEGSKIDDKPLHDELNKIRKDFTRAIKSLDGNVMLRGKQKILEERMDALEKQVEEYKATLRDRLEKEIASSLLQLKLELLPLVTRKPPSELINGCFGSKPTREEADRWLQYELEKAFPRIDTILREIELKKTFKDVTYSSLTNPNLEAELKYAFPAVQWDKPFEEYAAARAAVEGQK